MMDTRILLYTALACVIKESTQTCELFERYVALQCENIKTFTEVTAIPNYYSTLIIRNSNFTNLKANVLDGPFVHTIQIISTSLRTIEPSGFENVPCVDDLDLSHNNISTITRGIFNNLTELTDLDLSNNNIQFIENNSFCGSQIVDLNLHRNKIDTLPFLRNCTKLQILRISDNHIINLQNNHLPRSLRYLYLKNNRIENIEIEAFANMTELIELDLSNNKLYKAVDGCIPPGPLQPLVALSHLTLSRNGLSRILPDTFLRLGSSGTNQLTIDLSHNNISTITRGIFNNFTKFETLDLSDNNIQLIEDNSFFGSNTNYLDLHGNKIDTMITRDIFNNFTIFETVELSNNSIQFVENNSFLGSNISVLSLRGNKIDSLPILRNCTMLQTLFVSDNYIIQLQKNHLPTSLIHLYLGNNRIESIEMETFANMTKLTVLDLAYNKLYKVSDGCIPLGMLQSLVALESLNLSYNGLSRILLGTFSDQNALRTLDLGDNNLTHLPTGLLTTAQLRFFSIRNNMIKELDNNYFDTRNGVTVILDGNQWTCNYLAHKIHQILTINVFNMIISGTHYSSPNIMGIKCNPTESNITIDQSTNAKSGDILKIIASNNEDLQADLEGTNNLLFDIKDLLTNITLLKVKDLQQFQKTANETGDQFSNVTQTAPFDFKDMLNNVTIAFAENSEQLRKISSSKEELSEIQKTVTSTIHQFQENNTDNERISGDETKSELSTIRVLLLSLLLSYIVLIGLILAAFAFKGYTSKRNANVGFTQDTPLNAYT